MDLFFRIKVSLGIIFFGYIWVHFMYYMVPEPLPGTKKVELKYPSSLQDVTDLAVYLKNYADQHPLYVLFLYANAYIFKQAFCIPGSALLNILGGAIFGYAILPVVCFLTAFGASLAYCFSMVMFEGIIQHYYHHQINNLKDQIDRQRNDLFIILVSLRLIPVTPNWLLNLLSPCLGVPFHLFFLSILFGLLPYNFICVQSGVMLQEIVVSSWSGVVSYKQALVLTLAAAGFYALTRLIPRRFTLKLEPSHQDIKSE